MAKRKAVKRPAHAGLSPELLQELRTQLAFGGKRPYAVVVVDWDDAALISSEWTIAEQVLEDAKGHALITSVGLLLVESKDYILIALSVHDCVVDCVLKIPRSAVKHMKKLTTVVA